MTATILIIEDHNDIQRLLCEELSTDYQVLQAYSGTEGLLYLKTEKPDLVLLDIMLPGLSGQEVLEQARQFSDVPIIMVTALDDKAMVSQYLLSGANDYVTKPFDLNELRARIAVQLRLAHTSTDKPTETLKHLNITLDLQTFEIRSEAVSISLSKKEFDIFKLLLENPQKVFTKAQLYENVWKEPFLAEEHVLNTQLSNLRKKLHQLDPTQEYIKTVWGIGVRLTESRDL